MFGWRFFRSMIILSSQNDVQMTKTRVKWRIFWIKAWPLIRKFANSSSHFVISNQFIIVFIIIPFIPMSFHSFQCHSIYFDVFPFVPMSFCSFWCHSVRSDVILFFLMSFHSFSYQFVILNPPIEPFVARQLSKKNPINMVLSLYKRQCHINSSRVRNDAGMIWNE